MGPETQNDHNGDEGEETKRNGRGGRVGTGTGEKQHCRKRELGTRGNGRGKWGGGSRRSVTSNGKLVQRGQLGQFRRGQRGTGTEDDQGKQQKNRQSKRLEVPRFGELGTLPDPDVEGRGAAADGDEIKDWSWLEARGRSKYSNNI